MEQVGVYRKLVYVSPEVGWQKHPWIDTPVYAEFAQHSLIDYLGVRCWVPTPVRVLSVIRCRRTTGKRKLSPPSDTLQYRPRDRILGQR